MKRRYHTNLTDLSLMFGQNNAFNFIKTDIFPADFSVMCIA
ncbi:hypothetical protein XBI1_1150016 [Xenorhabdus bovienii str. Intermedium]|uniref:Uncharacterized protein n=1 Tax=Xenorhabdus bovienii str. Intermedium TaxID=1379677 RepID=A0A077QCR8_XENBV|nr:hypothetical protein XBI1_1150016 [Xenorhabdus bovienii str. Intermedium]